MKMKLCRRYVICCCCSILILVLLNFENWRESSGHRFENVSVSASRSAEKTIILWNHGWSSRRRRPILESWNARNDTFEKCPFKCTFVANRSLLEASDALVYNGRRRDALPLPAPRQNLNQVWVYFLSEPPVYFEGAKSFYSDAFNWTATYRLDSDVHSPYGYFEAVGEGSLSDEDATSMPTVESIRNKSLVTWLVSRCKSASRRELFAAELQKYLPLDVYGRCGSKGVLSCPQQRNGCFEKLAVKYKFYLAFENSLCADYVTEKFFRALANQIVPIVYAHTSVTRARTRRFPKSSYIDVMDFASIQELAKYLLHLDEHPDEYLKYFEWRKSWRVRLPSDEERWCNFCKVLHGRVGRGEDRNRKSYPSVSDWFRHNYTGDLANQCFDSKQVLSKIKSISGGVRTRRRISNKKPP